MYHNNQLERAARPNSDTIRVRATTYLGWLHTSGGEAYKLGPASGGEMDVAVPPCTLLIRRRQRLFVHLSISPLSVAPPSSVRQVTTCHQKMHKCPENRENATIIGNHQVIGYSMTCSDWNWIIRSQRLSVTSLACKTQFVGEI